MIQTEVYYPENPEKFRYNMQRRGIEYSDRVAHYNSGESMMARKDNVLIYHVVHATVFVNGPNDDFGRVNITANISSVPGEVEYAKFLLEEITKVRLIERDLVGSIRRLSPTTQRHMEK